MYIKLYQINQKRDIYRVRFSSHRLLPDLQDSAYVDSRIYDLVWEGELDAASLDDVFEILNNDVPDSFTARSLSVSDVVEVVRFAKDQEMEGRFFYCDPWAWLTIPFDPSKAGTKKAASAATETARK